MTILGIVSVARGIAAWRVLAFMFGLSPARGPQDVALRYRIAVAEVSATIDAHEQDLLSSVALAESNYDADVVACRRFGMAGDRTAWQVVPRSEAEARALCVTLEDDAAIALDRIRESVRACSHLPPPLRLSVYTRGRCDSAEGQRLSRIRWVPR